MFTLSAQCDRLIFISLSVMQPIGNWCWRILVKPLSSWRRRTSFQETSAEKLWRDSSWVSGFLDYDKICYLTEVNFRSLPNDRPDQLQAAQSPGYLRVTRISEQFKVFCPQAKINNNFGRDTRTCAAGLLDLCSRAN